MFVLIVISQMVSAFKLSLMVVRKNHVGLKTFKIFINIILNQRIDDRRM